MSVLQAALAALLIGSTAAQAGDLSSTLKEFSLTEVEKKETSSVIIPKIEVESKFIRQCFVRIHPGEGISLAIPDSDTTATIKRVFLNLETGGIYLVDGAATRYLVLLPPNAKEPSREKRIEHDFLRQFGYLLQQRHPKDPSTIKFFNRYFLAAPADSFSLVGNNAIEGVLSHFDPMDQVFHFMQKPSEWTGKECNDARCLFEHPDRGALVLTHPGSAELILDPDELLDPAEEKAPLAPEVASRNELEASLNALPPDVTKAFVLITHSKCPPCQALKREEGAWHKFCRLLRRVRSRKVVALMESTEGESIAASALMGSYSLPGSYPQMLVFERGANGIWQEPRTIAADQIAATLKAE